MLCVGVDVVAWPLGNGLVLPNVTWSFGVFVIAPLFAFFGNGVAVLISARVGDARLAQQLSGLLVMPLIGLAAGQFARLAALWRRLLRGHRRGDPGGGRSHSLRCQKTL